MFSEKKVISQDSCIYYRQETLTGFQCRISPKRNIRGLNPPLKLESSGQKCQFCPDNVTEKTPVFDDGRRIRVGESVTFPNLYPFAGTHVVTVITKEHMPQHFSEKQISDALKGQCEALRGRGGYPSINWNNLPSSGASLMHPHMQGICDERPTYAAGVYIRKSSRYFLEHSQNYWEKLAASEKASERFLFGDEIIWSANPVPFGEKEIRGYLPVSSISGFEQYIKRFSSDLLKIIQYYRRCGHYAFNMSVFFDREDQDGAFRAFASVIARINPNVSSVSDSAFMERLHFEPVILTLPEDVGKNYKLPGNIE